MACPTSSLRACTRTLRLLGSFRFLMGFLCLLECPFGVLQCLPGLFVCGQMIFFSVMLGSSAVCMSGEHVKLSGFLV